MSIQNTSTGLMTVTELCQQAGLTAAKKTFSEAVTIREVETVSKRTGKTSTRYLIDLGDEKKSLAEATKDLRTVNKKWSVKKAKSVAMEAIHGGRGMRWARTMALFELAREEYTPDVARLTKTGGRLILELVKDMAMPKPAAAPKAPTWQEIVAACNSQAEVRKAMEYLADLAAKLDEKAAA